MQISESAKRTATQLSILVVMFYVSLLGYKLSERGWDISNFIVAGDFFVHDGATKTKIAVLAQSHGYDGQFYYRLALNPFDWKQTDFGITIDDPPLRGGRIGYPLCAWLVSFGQANIVPWALVAINLASLFCITWIAVVLAMICELSAWYGLAVPLYPGFLLIITRDTTELLATALGLAAIFCVTRASYWSSAVFASGAVLTRETTLLYLAGFGLIEFAQMFKRKASAERIIALVIPLFILLVWHTLLFLIWHQSAFVSGDLGWPPLSGIIQFTQENFKYMQGIGHSTFTFKLHLYYLVAEAFCVIFVALAYTTLMRPNAYAGLRISWILYLTLVVCFTISIWGEPYGYLRIFVDCFVIGAAMIIASRHIIAIRLLFFILFLFWPPTIWFVTN